MTFTIETPLQQAAERAGRCDIVALAHQRVRHARTEEEVLYLAAVVLWQHIRLLLGQHVDHRAAA